MKRGTKHRKGRRGHRNTKRKVQRGGFSMADVMSAIGLRTTKDEDKIKKGLSDLEGLYSQMQKNEVYANNQKANNKLGEIITSLRSNKDDFNKVAEKIDQFNEIIKSSGKPELEISEKEKDDSPNVESDSANKESTKRAESTPAAKTPASEVLENLTKENTRQLLEDKPSEVAVAAGGKKSKKRKTKKSKKSKKKSKKYPKSKKHYNQRGGKGCSPLITPAKVNPFQGPPWKGGDVTSWPGVGGTPGVTNYLKQNKLETNPQVDRYPDMVSGIYT